MGADSIYFYYGVRRVIAQLNNDSHPTYDLAFDHKLHIAWGCLTDGADYFILIGHEIGRFGVEGRAEQAFTDVQLLEIVEKTKARLIAAGITVSECP